MFTVQTENAEIYYESHGEGPAIVLAHCAGGNSLVWWQQVVHFAPTHRVIAFDHRGWGRSRCELGHRRASHFAADMRAVMDDAGVERAAVVCQSMGGWTGMQFALANPERVSCLVLSCSPAGVQTPAAIRAMQTPPPSRAGNAEGIVPWNEPHIALAADAFERIPDRAFLYRQLSSLNPPFSDVGLGELRVGREELEGFSVSTLVIAGAQDRIFGLDVMTEVSQAIPGAAFHVIADAGHSPNVETPREYNEVVGRFIAENA